MRDPNSRKDINNSGDACRQQQRTQQAARIQRTLTATVIAIEGTPAKQQTYKGSSRISNSSRDASNVRGVINGRDAANSRHTRSITNKHQQQGR
jgi:hypothetical protein